MQSVIIITPEAYGIERLKNIISPDYITEEQSSNRILIERGPTHAWLELNNEIASDYESEELEKVLSLIPNPKFFLLEFNDFLFGKEILKRLGNSLEIVIDNDHGDILQGKEFVERLKKDQDWDWRISEENS